MTKEKAKLLRSIIEQAMISIEDETALNVIELFPNWKSNVSYSIGDRIQYNNKLYKVNQSHTSQADWLPDKTSALYSEIAKPGEILPWKQPEGAHDAYQMGDKVYYPDTTGSIWISLVDNNVWEPGVYGWQQE